MSIRIKGTTAKGDGDSGFLIPPGKKPIHKRVKAGGTAGAISVLVLGVADRIGLDITAVEAGAFATLVNTGIAWLVHAR